jgi:hypothetical protein
MKKTIKKIVLEFLKRRCPFHTFMDMVKDQELMKERIRRLEEAEGESD